MIRKALTLALLAAVAVAHAGSTATATSSVKATLDADPALTLNAVNHGEYLTRRQQASDPAQYYQFQAGPNLFDVDAFAIGDYVPVASTDATLTYSDGTTDSLVGNVLSLTSGASLTMAPTSDTNVVADGFLGHRYFLDYTNNTPGNLSVTFGVEISLGTLTHADIPDGGAPYFITDYANPTAFGGVLPVTFDAQGNAVPGVLDGIRVLDLNSSAPYAVDASDTFHDVYSRTYSLAPGERQVFEVYAAADATVAHVKPVPEPAAFAPLGLGAVTLLRRRRH